jgi:hypothetical protein
VAAWRCAHGRRVQGRCPPLRPAHRRSSSAVSGMLDEGILDALEPWLVLPEVKDPKQWWAAICGSITPRNLFTRSKPI